jgi:hypothetical protein
VDWGCSSTGPGSEPLPVVLGESLDETKPPLPDPSVGLPLPTGVPDVGAWDERGVSPRPSLLVEAADARGEPLLPLTVARGRPPRPLLLIGAPDGRGVSFGLLLRVKASSVPLLLLTRPLSVTRVLLDMPASGRGVPDTGTPAVVGLRDTLDPAAIELPAAELPGEPVGVNAGTPDPTLCVPGPESTLPNALDDPPRLSLTGCALELMLAPGRPPLSAPEGPGGEPVTMLAVAPPPLGNVSHSTAANGVVVSVTPL